MFECGRNQAISSILGFVFAFGAVLVLDEVIDFRQPKLEVICQGIGRERLHANYLNLTDQNVTAACPPAPPPVCPAPTPPAECPPPPPPAVCPAPVECPPPPPAAVCPAPVESSITSSSPSECSAPAECPPSPPPPPPAACSANGTEYTPVYPDSRKMGWTNGCDRCPECCPLGKRMALCVLGGFRTMVSHNVHRNVDKFIVQPTGADVFMDVSLVHTYVTDHTSYRGGSHKPSNTSNSELDQAVALLKPKAVQVRDVPTNLYPEFAEQCVLPPEFLKCPVCYYTANSGQYQRWEECLRLVKENEAKEKIRYDWVMRTRPDIRFNEELPAMFKKLFDTNERCYVGPAYERSLYDDKVAVMHRHYADAHFNADSWRQCPEDQREVNKLLCDAEKIFWAECIVRKNTIVRAGHDIRCNTTGWKGGGTIVRPDHGVSSTLTRRELLKRAGLA
eukprot:TRINITY_DN957_c0_g1_i2.p1 TRINITY_DN957_c0_g1~~TRINITY_DN957_c0_g1_i2.p1  ORF type:complete len:449 (+),score=125.88 TRINITY_DN957_c0_g1_i2:199-1545(+)